MMSEREIVHIDEEKCDGCGLCVPACAEGAIRIIDGKARLVSEIYCDGLGACLGHCPQGAITIVRREADAFDEAAVHEHLARSSMEGREADNGPAEKKENPAALKACPGTAPRTLDSLPVLAPGMPQPPAPRRSEGYQGGAALANWPVQLKLVPPNAPFLREADLLLVADCVPFACAEFHGRLLKRRPVVIGCPKLDDSDFYRHKLAAILRQSQVKSLTVIHMEVPCCTGLLRTAEAAVAESGADVPVYRAVVSVGGEVAEG